MIRCYKLVAVLLAAANIGLLIPQRIYAVELIEDQNNQLDENNTSEQEASGDSNNDKADSNQDTGNLNESENIDQKSDRDSSDKKFAIETAIAFIETEKEASDYDYVYENEYGNEYTLETFHSGVCIASEFTTGNGIKQLKEKQESVSENNSIEEKLEAVRVITASDAIQTAAYTHQTRPTNREGTDPGAPATGQPKREE
ncbi:hypothetical protein CG709_10865, partial [Lachnotalea glycerini]